ncbi:GDSL-type esterase/lipase family protein [Clavibacter zhangzhiyongii]|uniref:GDSL-type esterase/lipase family protein n=1 Tax=Clavibacter zhangzhiyongii TaxID=2768071 RepID=UPI0039E058DF
MPAPRRSDAPDPRRPPSSPPPRRSPCWRAAAAHPPPWTLQRRRRCASCPSATRTPRARGPRPRSRATRACAGGPSPRRSASRRRRRAPSSSTPRATARRPPSSRLRGERGGRTVPAQLDALEDGTDVVLVRLGGNDLGFPALVGGCLAQDPAGPVAAGPATCVDALAPAGGVDAVRARIDGEVSARLAEAFARIRAAAPDARVVALGYLTVLGGADALPADGCFRATATSDVNGRVLLTDRDAVWLAGVQTALDAAIARAAAEAGARFVDQEAPTAEHGACAGDAGDPYVAGVGGSAGSVPLHPNAAGLAWEADAIAAVLREEAAALRR